MNVFFFQCASRGVGLVRFQAELQFPPSIYDPVLNHSMENGELEMIFRFVRDSETNNPNVIHLNRNFSFEEPMLLIFSLTE